MSEEKMSLALRSVPRRPCLHSAEGHGAWKGGRAGRRAPHGPRLPAAAALPGWPFMPRRRERSLARFPSFVIGPGPGRLLPGAVEARPGSSGYERCALAHSGGSGVPAPSGHHLSPLAPHPVHLHSQAERSAQSEAGDPGVGVAGAQGRYLHPCGPLDVSRSPIHSAGFQAIKLPSEKRADTRVVPSFKHLACFYIGSL